MALELPTLLPTLSEGHKHIIFLFPQTPLRWERSWSDGTGSQLSLGTGSQDCQAEGKVALDIPENNQQVLLADCSLTLLGPSEWEHVESVSGSGCSLTDWILYLQFWG